MNSLWLFSLIGVWYPLRTWRKACSREWGVSAGLSCCYFISNTFPGRLLCCTLIQMGSAEFEFTPYLFEFILPNSSSYIVTQGACRSYAQQHLPRGSFCFRNFSLIPNFLFRLFAADLDAIITLSLKQAARQLVNQLKLFALADTLNYDVGWGNFADRSSASIHQIFVTTYILICLSTKLNF